MDNKEFFAALEAMEEERGIPKEFLADKIADAIVVAARKDFGGREIVSCIIDPEKKIFSVWARKEVVEEVDDDRVYDVVEENASFPGGDEECMKWLKNNIKYPSICQEQGVQGRVIVAFVVNRDGSIVDVKVVRSPDEHLSAEAVRVVKMMPKWKPARQGNKTVRSRFNLPVMFRLG